MRISLCMIARDEEDNLAECLRSVAGYVDEIIVVDTGSKDRTREVAQSFGARVIDWNQQTHPSEFFVDDEATCRAFDAPPPYSGLIALGNFAGARNASFEAATGDYVLWLDCDDTLEGAARLRELVADMHAKNIDQAMLAYDYAKDHLGRVRFRHWRERVVRRGASTWVNPIHEVLLPVHGQEHRSSTYDWVQVSHRRKGDRATIPNRNLKNLLREYKRQLDAGDNLDPRLLFYIGQEARFVDAKRAEVFYCEYLKRSGWGEERAAAHMALGELHEWGALGAVDAQRAYEHYATAVAESPNNPDGLFAMARIAQIRTMWHDCVIFTDRAFALGAGEVLLGSDPTARGYVPHLFYNYALNKLGRVAEAAESCRRGLAACPDDPGYGLPGLEPGVLGRNLKIYEAFLNQNRPVQPGEVLIHRDEDLNTPVKPVPNDIFVAWAIQLWKQKRLVDRDEAGALAMLESMPACVRLDSVWARMRELTKPKTQTTVAITPGKYASFRDAREVFSPESLQKKFVLWIGQNIEDWSPENLENPGIGGSESAAVYVCRELARRGWDVTVYGCPPVERDHDGVKYRRWESFAGCDADVFVSSRDPHVILHRDIRADVKLLWVHDIHCGPPSAEMERALLRFDRVLCLSEWHKRYFLGAYPTLHEDAVIVTRNGIDLERFADCRLDPPRAPIMIWSSSPPRRLDIALHNLKYIREQVPNVELRIFYGFETWEKFAQQRGDQGELAQIQAYRDMIANTPGAVYYGRVGQQRLAREFLQARVWGYPTDFLETSCITAMEAQAAGAVPVASKIAALSETVKVGTLIEPGVGYGQRYVDECVRLLTDDSYWVQQASLARKAATESFSWSALVDAWITMFDSVRQSAQRNPIHPWRRAS